MRFPEAKPPEGVGAGVCCRPRRRVGPMTGAALLMLLASLLYAARSAAAGTAQAASGPDAPAPVSLVIRNVYALTWHPEAGSVWPRAEISPAPVDIAVAGDRIAAIGPALAERHPQARIIDGQGGYAIPGLIDVHVHAGAPETGPNVWPLLVDVFSMRTAYRAGVAIVTGTDAGNPGVLYGLSVLREVELLHEAGLPPARAVAAATYQAAVELGELRATLKVGLSEAWGAGLQGFRFELGGPHGSAVLRGYPPGTLTGGSVAALTLDHRWAPLPDWPLGLHAFADVAFAWPSAAFGGGSDWGAAAGLGVSMSAGLFGAYRLDLAVTPSGSPAPVLWFQLNP